MGCLVSVLPVLLLLSACDGEKRDGSPAEDTGEQPVDTATSLEICNGADDDGDGEIDEGEGDLDEDGVADCVDTACALPPDTGWVAPASDCGVPGAVAAAPWSVEPMWVAKSRVGCSNARVLDLDADGVAEIVCADTLSGALQVFRGNDGTLVWSDRIVAPGSGLALADIDADGTAEIVAFARSGELVAYDSGGALVWLGDTALDEEELEADPIAVRDLDGDGSPEVITRRGIVSGFDGSLVTTLLPTLALRWDWEAELAVGDFDGDGVVDVASGWEVHRADGGGVRYDPVLDDWDGTITPLVVQADADAAGELVWFGNTGFVLLDDSGEELARAVDAGRFTYTLPCAGDIDGDGETELVAAAVDTILALDLDGAVLWSAPSTDSSGSYVACTAFDFDGDGADEVVVSDEDGMYLLDGRTGEVRYADDSRWSNTFGDEAIVVDLDGDGSVEILVSNPYGAGYDGATLRAWRNTNGDWPPGTRAWPVANWSGTGLLADGTVETAPGEPWLTTGVWRGQAEWPANGADLVASVDASCASACEAPGRVSLRLHLANLGPAEARPGAALAVYGLDADGAEALLTLFSSTAGLGAGSRSEDWELELSVEQAARGLRLVAGDAGTGAIPASDCAPRNNVTAWRLDDCD